MHPWLLGGVLLWVGSGLCVNEHRAGRGFPGLGVFLVLVSLLAFFGYDAMVALRAWRFGG